MTEDEGNEVIAQFMGATPDESDYHKDWVGIYKVYHTFIERASDLEGFDPYYENIRNRIVRGIMEQTRQFLIRAILWYDKQ